MALEQDDPGRVAQPGLAEPKLPSFDSLLSVAKMDFKQLPAGCRQRVRTGADDDPVRFRRWTWIMDTGDPLFERFLQPENRVAATVQLVDRGESAVPILVSLFDGSARNQYGVAYRRLGMPLSCGLIAAGRLGPLARPLEPFLVAELRAGHPYAAEALGALGALENDSVVALADALRLDVEVALGAAAALYRCSAADHPAVTAAASLSTTAKRALSIAKRA
ncbi:hypothetical protein K4L06_22380 [Lysobacter sp. BMK333-48F3]|uniref:hypothetical protein n=1 Tax=Lysobacter sp. BMK333-48F3 TaxID=2867962 RepID=UPI001C8BD6FA|nr:hypothetical protein [Lysobacter sp. BMK333-48F3]MBX9404055.1 hypothetical protein [Lysobacter sp. BMK333-48F3]